MINMNTNLGRLELHDEERPVDQDQTFEFISSPRIRRLDHTASTAMECPRCGSINTKFCYYNNYSKTQPRHFCKACKRHWTKGGTLRNIPTGGAARKNKRQKISKAAATAAVVATNSVTERDTLPPLCEFPFQSTDNLGSFVSYGGLLDLSQQQFSFSSLSSFENNNNPSSLSTASTFDIQSSADTYSYAERVNANSMEAAPDAFIPQPWPNCWNFEDIDTLVSSHELNIPNWDDPPLV